MKGLWGFMHFLYSFSLQNAYGVSNSIDKFDNYFWHKWKHHTHHIKWLLSADLFHRKPTLYLGSPVNFLFINTLRPRQNGRHFADDIFKCIFFNENVWISLKIVLKFVLKGPINNIPALVQIMACRLEGAKPLSEPMTVNLPTLICVARPQWVKISKQYEHALNTSNTQIKLPVSA